MKKIVISFIIVFVLGQSACTSSTEDPQLNKVLFTTIKGDVEFIVEIARTDESRKSGLMNREYLPENRGMFFVFDKPGLIGMWMKNTFIPLDMIFIDEKNEVVDILAEVQPCKSDFCETYESSKKTKYVLELNAGMAARYGINLGDKLRLQEF